VIYKEISLSKEKRTAPAADKITLQNFVFIIDEINRGDISKIFGELFYAVDPGYRGEKGKVKTQYSNLLSQDDPYYAGFFIPENVYIIGTMNDIDRSVESMDFAIRRRFTWKEIEAKDTLGMWDDTIPEYKEVARTRIFNLNEAIGKTKSLSKAFHIGPAYFLKLKEYNGDFRKLWDMHIQPLLKEYLRGMFDVDNALENLRTAYFGSSDSADGE
jgi:5-methylcytosine-specific restriction endonuclease McrBC GTP-binding regulatory subunit McrB